MYTSPVQKKTDVIAVEDVRNRHTVIWEVQTGPESIDNDFGHFPPGEPLLALLRHREVLVGVDVPTSKTKWIHILLVV